MPCSTTCMIAVALIIASIYFQNATTKSKIVKEYKKQLPSNLQNLYEAYKIHHINSNTYSGTIKYSPICIYCKNTSSNSLMNDGGSFRQCKHCKKNFKATIINETVQNFSYSTHHLKGTN